MWYQGNYYKNGLKYHEFTLEELMEIRKKPAKLDALLKEDLATAVREVKHYLDKHTEVAEVAKTLLKAGVVVDEETTATLRSMGVSVPRKKKKV
jgi:hypothetical protein